MPKPVIPDPAPKPNVEKPLIPKPLIPKPVSGVKFDADIKGPEPNNPLLREEEKKEEVEVDL